MLTTKRLQERTAELLKAQSPAKVTLDPQLKAVLHALVDALVEEVNARFESERKETQDLVSKVERQVNAVQVTPSGRMKRPTPDQVLEKTRERKMPDEEAENFYNHYESNGWKVGGVPMKNWVAALANWKKNWQKGIYGANGKAPEALKAGPTHKELMAYADQKWGYEEIGNQSVSGMAQAFYTHWSSHGWSRNGVLIAWQEELTGYVAKKRAAAQ